MKMRRLKNSKGTSLVEVMLAVLLIMLLAIGTMSYQVQASRHSRIANAQIKSTRVAELLLEDWKSNGGSGVYNPLNLGLGFSSVSVPESFDEGDEIGAVLNGSAYLIKLDELPMIMVLRYSDVDTDTSSNVTLRRIGIILKINETSNTAGSLVNMEPIIVQTYVRMDASGG